MIDASLPNAINKNVNIQHFSYRFYHVFDPGWKSIGVSRKIYQTNHDSKKPSYETWSYVYRNNGRKIGKFTSKEIDKIYEEIDDEG